MNIAHNTTAYAIENYLPKDEKPKFTRSFYVSHLGEECPKRQWLTFINAFEDTISNRTKRIFFRGNQEEHHIIKILRDIGIEVVSPHDTPKEHFKIQYLNGHISGVLDAVAIKGVPEAPHKPHVLEFKTMNDKAYQLLMKNGLEKGQPKHFGQIQTYMDNKNIDRGLYIAVNKNTDEIYIERVKLIKRYTKKLIDDASTIILSKNFMPPAISEDKTFFKCKMCPASKVCHGDEMPKINCRTCIFSSANEDGNWYCGYWKKKIGAENPITLEFQEKGCQNHFYIPALMKLLNKHALSTENNLDQELTNPDDYYFIWHFNTHFVKLSATQGFSSEQIKKLNLMVLDENFGRLKEAFPDVSVC